MANPEENFKSKMEAQAKADGKLQTANVAEDAKEQLAKEEHQREVDEFKRRYKKAEEMDNATVRMGRCSSKMFNAVEICTKSIHAAKVAFEEDKDFSKFDEAIKKAKTDAIAKIQSAYDDVYVVMDNASYDMGAVCRHYKDAIASL